MSSVLKLETIEFIKFSRMMTARMDFHSEAFSPSSKQMDSKASLTIAGGLAILRTSTRCCFLMDFTAVGCNEFIGIRREREIEDSEELIILIPCD